MVELSLPALAPAAAALVSGGYAAEAAHGVVVHGLRGPMENVPAANALASAMAPAALAQLRADGVAVPTVVKFAGCEGLPFSTVLKLRVLKQAASQHAEQQAKR
ncbi:hypothetical protein DUNSADRAFT_5300 [Dunaliella salina]|uniref:Uncharacterized protein n=1 Tax=Dunaliella salina TaxID=3046 RepID=A0ABQ7GQI1_DUNSA|nr:hypothetical protein DUNSADRAFT_5300 [Dunaliella salina]|eukprot:KAF5836861.1 hypothetical protein DUNSADRAFT_5300 [Dunaliella salina]